MQHKNLLTNYRLTSVAIIASAHQIFAQIGCMLIDYKYFIVDCEFLTKNN